LGKLEQDESVSRIRHARLGGVRERRLVARGGRVWRGARACGVEFAQP
jgi:hypothetical protein